MSERFQISPRGPYSLSTQRQFFGDWLSLPTDPAAVLMTFPVEGWLGSASVVVREMADGTIEGTVATTGRATAEQAWTQALATLSLDVDGSAFPDIAARDAVIGGMGARYGWLRPVCFHSPYEAAVNFVVGQRISMSQARAVRARLARELGAGFEIDGQTVHAFPAPEVLAGLERFSGIPDEKLARLRGIARAGADGELDRDRLRAFPVGDALAGLRRLRGVGPFAAQGILHRGAGLVDAVTDDDVTREAVGLAYPMGEHVTQTAVEAIAELWRPYRTWATVLLHVWLRREQGGRRVTRQERLRTPAP